MALSLKHAFNSAKADGVDSTLIQPSNWNAEHALLMASSRLVGRTTGGTGAAEEISVGSSLVLASGSLNLASTVSLTALTASGAVTGASVAATGAVTGASVAATGAVTGASVAATGDVSGATVTTPIIKTGAGLSLAIKNNANTETHATFTDNGASALYYDNAKKIETSATGATITGALSADTVAGNWVASLAEAQAGAVATKVMTPQRVLDAINANAPSTSTVLGAIAGATVGAVGTYAFLGRPSNTGALTAGTSYAGSSLRYAGELGTSGYGLSVSATTPSGTWLAMGTAAATADTERATLFLRIA